MYPTHRTTKFLIMDALNSVRKAIDSTQSNKYRYTLGHTLCACNRIIRKFSYYEHIMTFRAVVIKGISMLKVVKVHYFVLT